MGFFDSLLSPFEYIGSGISKAATTVKHSVLDPIYNKVLKPVYNKVVVPVYNRLGNQSSVPSDGLPTKPSTRVNTLPIILSISPKRQARVTKTCSWMPKRGQTDC